MLCFIYPLNLKDPKGILYDKCRISQHFFFFTVITIINTFSLNITFVTNHSSITVRKYINIYIFFASIIFDFDMQKNVLEYVHLGAMEKEEME